MTDSDLFRSYEKFLHDLELKAAELSGRILSLKDRKTYLEEIAGKAKRRQLIKKDVDHFLDQLQNDAHKRSIGIIDTLLSSLAEEVLPNDKRVKLDLTVQSGLPSLDIMAVSSDGKEENLLEDNGGALTNVVCTGLRLLSVVKSRSLPFVALDEPDCWVAPHRIPSFFHVFEDAANRLNLQCFIISHHDIEKFDAKSSIAKLTGHPFTGISVQSTDFTDEWNALSEKRAGLRYIRLIDFQASHDSILHLSPRVTVLTGENNRGKSCFMRALRAVFFGEDDVRNSLVRHGAKSAIVEIGLANGRYIKYVRQPARSPVNIWSLHENNGVVVEENGIRHESGGRTPPDWIGQVSGIYKISDLDIHIAKQKKPVFLLDEPGSRRAAVLSIGQESDHIREMMRVHKERSASDSVLIKDSEREMAEILKKIGELSPIPAIKSSLDSLKKSFLALEKRHQKALIAEDILTKISDGKVIVERLKNALETLTYLPSDNDFSAWRSRLEWKSYLEDFYSMIVQLKKNEDSAKSKMELLKNIPETPRMHPVDAMITLGRSYVDMKAKYNKNKGVLSCLENIPKSPVLQYDKDMDALYRKIFGIKENIQTLTTNVVQLQNEKASIDALIEQKFAENGGKCPVCGQGINKNNMICTQEVVE